MACGGNPLDNFYSLFTCEHVNCEQCHLHLKDCCHGIINSSTTECKSDCLNFYNIDLQKTICTKVKSFGYDDKHNALAIVFNNGVKKLFLNVDKSIYYQLIDLNKDMLSIFIDNNICTKEHECIDIN